ncbi:hypothetical protein HDU81_010214 [Chytriomyces hyalinus]|nr:hypothetical protein HDU81_010214 [Chytriomyces hyalinus]
MSVRDDAIAHVFDVMGESVEMNQVAHAVDAALSALGEGAAVARVVEAALDDLIRHSPGPAQAGVPDVGAIADGPSSDAGAGLDRVVSLSSKITGDHVERATKRMRANETAINTTHPQPTLNPLAKLKWNNAADREKAKLLTHENIADHVPCELFLNWLPPTIADPLLLFLIKDAKESWNPNKYYINERLVYGSHKSTMFTSLPASQFSYSFMGSETKSNDYTCSSHMRETSALINEFVTRRLRETRVRLHTSVSSDPLRTCANNEDGPGWDGNLCIGNEYLDGKQITGFHSDHLGYIGPRPVIASVSLGATRTFRIRRIATAHSLNSGRPVWQLLDSPNSKSPSASATSTPNLSTTSAQSNEKPLSQYLPSTATTYSVKLPHGSLLIMYPPMQELYKHEVPPESNFPGHPLSGLARYNLTFRMHRPEFSNPPLCKCGVRTDLKPVFKQTAEEPQSERYYWSCVKGRGGQMGCGHFEWLK